MMKNIKNTLVALVAMILSTNLFAAEHFLVGGSGWNKIAIIDKDSKAPIWMFPIPSGGECNSLCYTKAGNIAFSYKKGVAVVTQDNNMVFNYEVKAGEEAQSMSEIKGGYLVGVCGTPSRILELDKYGKLKKEITYNLGLKNPHAQHRQIAKTKGGHYLVPVTGKGLVLELDGEGNTVREVKIGGSPFSITVLPNGNWLVPCGDIGYLVEVNPDTEEVVNKIDNEALNNEINFGFVAQSVRYKNGNTVICNWLGHTKDKGQPILLELNSENKIIWSIENHTPNIGSISAICPLEGKFFK